VATLKKNYVVKKRNVLNEMRVTDMKLEERRFLAIYLSKINPDDLSTRLVRFTLDDFKAIMNLSQIKIKYIKEITDNLLRKIVSVPMVQENGRFSGYRSFQLFKECAVVEEDGKGYVEIDAHDKALPLMFDFKKEFFTYKLENALQVKSSNQLCMYEILKQYEKVGFRILSVDEVKEKLGLAKTEYPRFGDFKNRVLTSCQEALAEHTDITFTFEPYGKRGKGGKVLLLKFNIQKNDNYVDQLSLPDFIEQQEEILEISDYDRKMIFLSEACDNEFSVSEIRVFYDTMVKVLPLETIRDERECYNYLMRKYRYMIMRDEKNKINDRRAYIESIIGKD